MASAATHAQTTAASAAPATSSAPAALTALPSLDVSRYMGQWYQLALIPNRFQEPCVSNTRATYALQADGRISVRNECRKADGQTLEALGQARPARGAVLAAPTASPNSAATLSPAQLQVRFAPAWLSWLPMVWGDYWVMDLAPDGRYALVGEPSRQFLWVLARSTALPAQDWAQIDITLRSLGYDPARLVREKHMP